MDTVDTIVIGGGVIGLAIAARLARSNETLVLEKNSSFGQEVSARNSEVIHAGIYYAPGSLKAQLCVEGKQALYHYCESRGVGYKRIGKLIVASGESDLELLEGVKKNAAQNGVTDLELLDHDQVKRLEPEVAASGAIYSPSTGIVSAHELMNALAADVDNHSGQIATHCQVKQIDKHQHGFVVRCSIEGESYDIQCRQLVNACGLHAQDVAERCDFLKDDTTIPAIHLCKGVYFSYSGKSPFSHLIYPLPEPNQVGLGIHATLDLGGSVKFGPDTTYIDTIEYSVPAVMPKAYLSAIRRYFPGVDSARLTPDYSGIRPKLTAEGEAAKDFVIESSREHGIDGYIQLFGIESPGLTSSLAIADYVADRL